MTAKEYLSRDRFPLSNLQELSLRKQMMVDAINYDDLKRMEDEGRPMSEDQAAVWKELQEKRTARQGFRKESLS